MKKLLLVLGLSPLAVFAQQIDSRPIGKGRDVAVPYNPLIQQEIVKSPVRVHNSAPAQQRRNGRLYNINAEQVGTTFYDLMTNNSMPRRVILYPNGKVSVAWTFSNNQNQDFLDRGTAYNHFNGTSWIGQNSTRFEAERAGWPNLLNFTEGGTEKEMIISHYASGGTGVSGGTFWMKNSGVGSSTFTTFETRSKPNGPLWPRAAVTGDRVHMIAVYNTYNTISGIVNPIVYSRYNVTTGTFDVENILLPGYDNTRYRQGAADEYSIDARDSVVAILIGGAVNDLALWKSTDKGQTWTKTIIDSFPEAPWSIRQGEQTLFDTTETNDGSGTVTVDRNGNAHVFWARMRVLNDEVNDSTYSYFPGTDGIMYWNDKDKQQILVGGRINYNDDVDILPGTTQTSYASYGGNALSTFPVATVDASNNIYMIYSSPNEMDITLDEEANFRDLYIVYSTDGGKNWSDVQAVTQNVGMEDVFPSLARDADNNIHLLWMQDETPGIFLVNTNEVVLNKMMYAAIPTQDILQNKLGLPNVSVNEKLAKDVYVIGDVYPNPATSMVTIPVNMKVATPVSVKVVDMLGKVVTEENTTRMPSGKNNLTLNVENLTAGVYFCQITAEGHTITRKIVVNK